MKKYINPYTECGFRKLFGEDSSKVLLIDFLNQLLPAHHQITSIYFDDIQDEMFHYEYYHSNFDIYCTANNGIQFIIELKNEINSHFKEKALFNIANLIRKNVETKYWNYELNFIYHISMIDFFYEKHYHAKYYRHVDFKDQFNENFYSKLSMIYLQIPAFNKNENEITSKLDKWIYFLKYLDKFNDVPALLNEPIFLKAFKIADISLLSPTQLHEYEKSKLNYLDILNICHNAKAEGIKERNFEIAKLMKINGEPIENIAQYTGLSIEIINQL